LQRPARQRARWFSLYRRELIDTYRLATPLALEDAYRLATLHVERKVAGLELGAARQLREEGTGRRPSVARIASLQKRANLADKAFVLARKDFETKYRNGQGTDLAQALQAAQTAPSRS
jgi:hypothetical protein